MKCKLVSLHLVRLLENLWRIRLRLFDKLDWLRLGSKIICFFIEAGTLLLILSYEIIYCCTIHLRNVRCIYCYYYPRISNYICTSTILCSYWIYTYLCRDLYIATDKENSRLVLVFFNSHHPPRPPPYFL